MPGKYRTNEPDLMKIIADLRSRISKLERTPQIPNTGISTGGIVVNGGSIIWFRPGVFESLATNTEGVINIGSNISINGEEGMAIVISRSETVSTDYLYPDGSPILGASLMRMGTVDGSIIDPDFAFPSFEIYDKSGDILIADSLNARRGFSAPDFSIPFTDKVLATTTSGTYSDIAGLEWYQYHPHLRFRLVYFNDASTTGEISIIEEDTSREVVEAIITPAGGPAYVDIVMRRSRLTNGASPNGNPTLLNVRHRRATGAGTVRTRVASIVGIDLSWFEGF